jgi:prephenate dehydratase
VRLTIAEWAHSPAAARVCELAHVLDDVRETLTKDENLEVRSVTSTAEAAKRHR